MGKLSRLRLVVVLGFISQVAFAQEVHFKTIRDRMSKETLPFANISVVGSNRGTVSNSEGQFVMALDDLPQNMEVEFSYVGYRTLIMTVSALLKTKVVYMEPATVNLEEVEVSSQELTAIDIIDSIRANYEKNYPKVIGKQRIFFHKFEKTPFPESNQITVKRSDFVGLDKETFDEFYQLIPKEFIEYQDAVIDLYQQEDSMKLVPVEAISLEEGSMENITKEIEDKLGELFEDIEKTNRDKEVYYKFRSGIFAFKSDEHYPEDSTWSEQKEDSVNYLVNAFYVRDDMLNALKNFGTLDGGNWEFIKHPDRYDYLIKDITVIEDQMVFPIQFMPKKGTSKKKGVFRGSIYVNIVDYGIHQLDFAYANGKRTEHIQLLGIGHDMLNKRGRVIFEKKEEGYFIKYINAHQHETASIDRKLSVMKKKKRFLFDKELAEIKAHIDLSFDINTYWEVLVQSTEPIDKQSFDDASQPKNIKFKRKFAYTPDMWDSPSVIAPTKDLQQYTRR